MHQSCMYKAGIGVAYAALCSLTNAAQNLLLGNPLNHCPTLKPIHTSDKFLIAFNLQYVLGVYPTSAALSP